MSVKDINFDDKKIQKSDFYKNKKVNKIDDINVNEILVSKTAQNIHLNFLLDIMIMMLLDPHKSLAMLENLMKIQQRLLE